MILYHGGSTFLEHPKMPEVGYSRSGHPNGAMGIWCAADKELAEQFAGPEGRVTTIYIHSNVMCATMHIDLLTSMAKAYFSEQHYIDYRNMILERTGAAILGLEEIDGSIAQYIILSTSAILRTT